MIPLRFDLEGVLAIDREVMANRDPAPRPEGKVFAETVIFAEVGKIREAVTFRLCPREVYPGRIRSEGTVTTIRSIPQSPRSPRSDRDD